MDEKPKRNDWRARGTSIFADFKITPAKLVDLTGQGQARFATGYRTRPHPDIQIESGQGTGLPPESKLAGDVGEGCVQKSCVQGLLVPEAARIRKLSPDFVASVQFAPGTNKPLLA